MEAKLIEVINNVFTTAPKEKPADAETQLYEGFICDADRHQCNAFISSLANKKALNPKSFQDKRLQILSLRYLNRNFSELRTNQQSLDNWRNYVHKKLFVKADPHNQSAFEENRSILLECLRVAETQRDQQILESLLKRSTLLRERYCEA